jgi:hypothetical protein
MQDISLYPIPILVSSHHPYFAGDQVTGRTLSWAQRDLGNGIHHSHLTIQTGDKMAALAPIKRAAVIGAGQMGLGIA